MRRTYISPEFEYRRVFGTLNMKEESTFLSSKMLEIEDYLELNNQSIIYYQNKENEQIDLDIEKLLSPNVYSSGEDKNLNKVLSIDETQGETQKNNLTKYNIKIDLKTILSNYLFATLKQYRTFEGVKNTMCYNKDVNFSIREYIIRNIIDRYKFDKIELYIRYVDIREQNVRRYLNNWYSNSDIIIEENLNKKIQTDIEYDQSSLSVIFNQDKTSQQYSFEYYFKLFWVKI